MTRRPTDTEPRHCRRWDDKTATWKWKKRYGDRDEAVSDGGPGQDVYPCGHCGFWHRASQLPQPRTITISYDLRRLPRVRWHR